MTSGLRMMWMKRALGNISSKILMRKVCGGDFKTIRRGVRTVRHLRNHISPLCQRARSPR